MNDLRRALVIFLLLALPGLSFAGAVDYLDETPQHCSRGASFGMWSRPIYRDHDVNLGAVGAVRAIFHREQVIQGTLLAKGEHCAVYVKDGSIVANELPNTIVRTFDETVYPGTKTLFGDNCWPNKTVSILLISEGANHLGGYINPLDGFPKDKYRYSNEDALISVDLPDKVDSDALFHLLSTQFAHLITMNLDPDESVWVRTALSHYAGFHNSYGHTANLRAFLNRPTGVSLTDWAATPTPENLGAAYMFAHFMADTYGNGQVPKLFSALANEAQNGEAGIAAALGKRFERVFVAWAAANAVNSQKGHNGAYGYQHIDRPVELSRGGSLLSVTDPFDGKLPRWSAAYVGFEQKGNWSPDFPTIHDEITFAYDRPGKLVWGINGWKLPPEQYWPEGSSKTTFNGKQAVASPLVESPSVTGLFRTVLPPLKHAVSVDSVNFAVVFDDGEKTEENGLPISHDQNLSMPAVEVEFKGQSGWFSSSKKFALALGLRDDEGDCLVKDLKLSSNKFKDVITEFGIYYTRMVLIPCNVSLEMSPGETLDFTFQARLKDAQRDFDRCLHLQVKLYEGAARLYTKIVEGVEDPDIKRRYLVMTRQYSALTDEVIRMLAQDIEYKNYKDFDSLQRFAYGLTKEKVVALRALVDKAIPVLRKAIQQQNNAGVTPDPELDLLLFKISNLRAYIYEAGESQAGGEWEDDDDDISSDDDDGPICPVTDEDYIAAVQETVTYLGDLPIDQILARDVLEKILGAFILTVDDEITELLKAFGLNIDIDFTSLPFNYILKLIKLKSYDMTTQQSLVDQWTQGLTDEERQSLRRLYLSQQAVQTGFKSSLVMAEDASEGFYDVVDLALGAVKVADHVMSSLEHVPIVGHFAKKIKVKIIQRIIYGLNNAVQFVTQKLKEPWRSRVAAVCNAITTAYIKWKDIQIEEGFGGINAKLFAKIGVKVLGKTALLMTPKLGFVSKTQPLADKGAQQALNNDYYGTFDEAKLKVVDDLDPDTENAILERVINTTARKRKLSLQERQIANFAGCVSQIAQYMHMLDPSGITKLVAIVAGAFAGGLQLHSVFNSIHYFYKIPSETKRAVILAFNPGANVDDKRFTIDDLPFTKMNQSSKANVMRSFSRAVDNYGDSLKKLRQATESENVASLNNSLPSFEDASHGLRKGMKMMQLMDFGMKASDDDVVSTALMNENFASADLFSRVLDFSFKPTDRRKKKALLGQIGKLEADTAQTRAFLGRALARSRVRSIARIDHMAPAAMQVADELEVKIPIINAGAAAATNVQCSLIVPTNWKITSRAAVAVANIDGQSETEVTFTVKRLKKLNKTHQVFSFTVLSDNGGSTHGVIYIAKEKKN